MKMKVTLIQILCFVALAKATDDIDMSNVTRDRLVPSGIMTPHVDASSSRIVGGVEVTPHSIPYQAAILIPKTKGISFCGGSLITKQTVLTAAHCVDTPINPMTVILGAHNIRKPESTSRKITTSQYHIHDAWDRPMVTNDIAVVYLPSPVELSSQSTDLPCASEAIRLIPLAVDPSQDYELQDAVVSGWGRTSDEVKKVSDVLRKVTLRIIDNKACSVPYFGIIKDTNICASGLDRKSSCNADSGGPLVVDGVQIGIVSFGSYKGCEVGWPTVYTRVTSYKDWLDKHVI